LAIQTLFYNLNASLDFKYQKRMSTVCLSEFQKISFFKWIKPKFVIENVSLNQSSGYTIQDLKMVQIS
jgi:hypothetical protein